LDRLARLLPAGPPPALRSRVRFRVLAEVAGPGGRATMLCEGVDPYALTARFLVEAALAAATGGGRTGALAPAQALDPAGFLEAVSGGPPARADGATLTTVLA
ncbi:MAG: hypothetical protein ACRDZ9_02950, partial [Acidimicrobiales bacterium]